MIDVTFLMHCFDGSSNTSKLAKGSSVLEIMMGGHFYAEDGFKSDVLKCPEASLRGLHQGLKSGGFKRRNPAGEVLSP